MSINAPGFTVRSIDLHRERTREGLRRQVTLTFLDESPGTKYHYVVETARGGGRIYLKRPTYLNKGFDFQIWIENWTPGQDKRPSHADVKEDLTSKKRESYSAYAKLSDAIRRVHSCEEPDDILNDYPNLRFRSGMSVEMILKTLKWLFIEQDITYWNYTGRNMLKKAIDEI